MSDLRLKYGATSSPFPMVASPSDGAFTYASLTIEVSNPSDPIRLQGLMITLPIGATGTELTSDPAHINVVLPPEWTVSKDQAGQGIWRCIAPKNFFLGAMGLSFSFVAIPVNRQTGTFTLKVEEATGVDPIVRAEWKEDITKFPTSWGTVSFSVNLPDVPYDKPLVFLHWDGPATAAYKIEYLDHKTNRVVNIPGHDQPALPARGQYPSGQSGIALTEMTVFTLNVSEDPYQAQKQLTVNVAAPKPKINRFVVNWLGEKLELIWDTEHAEQVEISQVPGLQKGNGTFVFQPSPAEPLQGIITLTARSAAGSVTSTLIQKLQPANVPPIQLGEFVISVAVSPDRVFCLTGSERTKVYSLQVFDARTCKPAGSPVGVALYPGRLTVSRDGTLVFVASYLNKMTVTGLDAQTLRPLPGSPWTSGPGPNGLSVCNVAVHGSRVYAVNGDDNTLTVLDARTLKPVPGLSAKVGEMPSCVALPPDGKRVFVGTMGDNQLWVLSADNLQPVPGKQFPYINCQSLAITPDGKRVFVVDGNNAFIRIMDAEKLTEAKGSPVQVGGQPWCVAVSPDSALVFVTVNKDDASRVLVVLDAQTLKPMGSPITIGNGLGPIAVSPDGTRVFVGNDPDRQVTVFSPVFVPA